MSRRYPLTRREQAEAMGISERSVDMYRAVERLRPDLAKQINHRNFTIHMAYQMAREGEISKTWTALALAWNHAPEHEQRAFLEELGFEVPPEE
jgi:hypothetical protein